MTDQSILRIGNAEREHAVEELRRAAEDGKLDAAELDERIGRVRAAKTVGQLQAVMADLQPPAQSAPVPVAVQLPSGPVGPPGYSPADPLRLMAGFSADKRGGAWEVPPFLRAQALADNVKLDCLEARHTTPTIDLEVLPGAGNVVLVLPEGWAVNTERLGKSLGSIRVRVPSQPAWGAPLFVVHGTVGLGAFKARGANWFDRRRLGLDR
ncbi:MAG: DUF1707 domain-containing protein [Micropruina sp.]|nr:MAG: DUF1707 domain-containing protein [Micropruina sp.]